jgi:hypothetical protein
MIIKTIWAVNYGSKLSVGPPPGYNLCNGLATLPLLLTKDFRLSSAAFRQ